jgi:1-acyl-sn-glycerol-3-phosphate acyltransferase
VPSQSAAYFTGMQQPFASTRRTAGDTIRLAPRDGQAAPWPQQRQVLRHLRAVRRLFWMVLFTPAACLIQAVLLAASPTGRVEFALFYWKTIAQMLGLQVRVIGAPLARAPGRRPVIYVCNHSSWLDIPALGGSLRACFVSKDDVAGWPIVGTIARLGRTVFVSRSRQGIGRERDQMQERLAAGDALILFPEGTSSDGARVLPFHSSFFAAAYGEAKPLIQPVSVVYDRLANLPVSHSSRSVFAWYGDMELAPHVWRIAQWRGKRVTLLFHTPLDPAAYASRKALSQAAWQIVADGAATLRQNRPASPLPAGSPATQARPALA